MVYLVYLASTFECYWKYNASKIHFFIPVNFSSQMVTAVLPGMYRRVKKEDEDFQLSEHVIEVEMFAIFQTEREKRIKLPWKLN